MVACRRPPKGWICTRDKDHDGACKAQAVNAPLIFLRRDECGKLERLVTDGEWTGWISAERPARYWWVWQAIARARGI